jgi:hypothetical protein
VDNKLTDYHYFEVMDRSYIAVDIFNEHIVDHPAVQSNPELKKQAEYVSDILYKFYCLTSNYLDGTDKELRTDKYNESL